MKWDNLKYNLCPSCNSDLGFSDEFIECEKCEFRIREVKMKKIVQDYNSREFLSEERNLGELNNL